MLYFGYSLRRSERPPGGALLTLEIAVFSQAIARRTDTAAAPRAELIQAIRWILLPNPATRLPNYFEFFDWEFGLP
jgi:hypothetical protein